MHYALSELEAKHHHKELAIMERMELGGVDRSSHQLGGLVTKRL